MPPDVGPRGEGGVVDPLDQRGRIRRAFQRADLSPAELWLRYFSSGGSAGPADLEDFLRGAGELDALERDTVAQAVNERLDEVVWLNRAPYSRPLRPPLPDRGALAALVTLVEGVYLAPAERLAAVLDEAAAALGVNVVLYVVDNSWEELVPFPGRYGRGRSALSLDGSLGGRAVRRLEHLTSVTDGVGHLWVPVLDGVERLGVLDVTLGEVGDLGDPALRSELWNLAHLTGHLLTVLARTGDGIDRLRRRRPRTLAAELVWSLLPPLNVATDRVVVSGRLEPTDAVGGDVFDCAVSETTAHLAVIDATGHDLAAGLVAATAITAYRNARRGGASLFDQAQAVHEAIRDQFAGETFATGVVAQLDLYTGRVRYVAAGHPYPLVIRRGRVVRMLSAGRRTLFGLEARDITVAEEQLEPEDVLVLYTDGITEAKDADRTPFGVEGLTGILDRETAAETPLPEVVRRVCKAVLHRQGGVLEDDATLLLVHWTTRGQRLLGSRAVRG